MINNLFTLLFFLQQHHHSIYIQSAMKSASIVYTVYREGYSLGKKIILQTKNATRNILILPFGLQQLPSHDRRSCHLKGSPCHLGQAPCLSLVMSVSGVLHGSNVIISHRKQSVFLLPTTLG